MINRINIYDLDGTIIDSSHRYRTNEAGNAIDLPHWREHDTPEHIARDALLPLANAYMDDMTNPWVYVIAATARACVPDDANYKYLVERLGFPHKFVHREGPDDNRGGAELKIQAIKKLLTLRQFKGAEVHVFEDNQSYLDKMCKALGAIPHFIPSCQGH